MNRRNISIQLFWGGGSKPDIFRQTWTFLAFVVSTESGGVFFYFQLFCGEQNWLTGHISIHLLRHQN